MTMASRAVYEYIDSDEALARFCGAVAAAQYCAIDTEFIRESTYYPELALIQIASDYGQACVDPLAVNDFKPLAKLLVDETVTKVFHSSSQDLEILYQKFGQVPTPIFDTQLAAAVLGFNHQISYADLVQQITGVVLAKKHTRANWIRRPLSQDELDYAMDDVRYLSMVYEHLREKLNAKDRFGWIEKDLLALTDPIHYEVDFALLWKRLKGVQKLKGEKLQIASDLCQWREALAQRQNRPRRWIVKDEAIVDLARQKPANLDDLEQISGLSEKTVKRHGHDLIRLIDKAGGVDASQWPRQDQAESLDSQQMALADCLMALCRTIADQQQIALATLATRKDVDNLVLDQSRSRLTQGWRFAMAGEALLEFLHGQTSIGVADKTITVIRN